MWLPDASGRLLVHCDNCQRRRACAPLTRDGRGRLRVPPGWVELEVVSEHMSQDHCPRCIQDAQMMAAVEIMLERGDPG